MSAPSFAADTTDVDNDQVLNGDFLAENNVTVGDVDEATSNAGAYGNTMSVDYQTGNVNVQNDQTLNGSGTSSAVIDMDSANTSASASASTMGNSATITSCCDAIDVNSTQTVGAGQTMSAEAGINMTNWAMNPAVSALSTANAQSVETTYGGALNNALNQTSQSNVYSDAYIQGGGAVADSATIASTAIGNSGFAGGGQTTLSSAVDQANHGNVVQATTWLETPDVEDAVVASTATGNNYSIENSWGYVQSYVNQDNSSYVRAQTEGNVGIWNNPNSATAYAVGNSNLTSNIGSDVYIDNLQLNDGGGVESVVTWNAGDISGGGVGNDVWTTNSTAIGNAVSGYVCGTCQSGGITGYNSQVNNANVTATSNVSVGGGSVVSSTMAVGNSATFHSTGGQ